MGAEGAGPPQPASPRPVTLVPGRRWGPTRPSRFQESAADGPGTASLRPGRGRGRGRGHRLGRPPLTPAGQGPPIVLRAKQKRFPVPGARGRQAFSARVLQTSCEEPLPLRRSLPNARSQRPGSRRLPLLGTRGWGPPSPAPSAVSGAIPRARGGPGHRGGVTT